MIRVNNTVGRAALTVVALLCLWPAVISCVKEDLSYCPPIGPNPPVVDSTKTFRFKMIHKQTDVAVTPADMKRAVVYIFHETAGPDGAQDADGLYAALSLDNPVFDHEYDTGLVLPDGGYEIIVWVNPDEPYSLYPGETKESYGTHAKSEGRMSLTLPENKVITEKLPFQLWGGELHSIGGGAVNPTRADSTEIDPLLATVPMYLNNYIITISTEGLDATSDEYAFRVNDNNGYYDFEDNYVAGDDFYYETDATFVPATRAEGDELSASITTLKIGDGRHPDLSLRNDTTGDTIFPANDQQMNDLIALIERTQAESNYVEVHRYDIVLDFTGSDPNATDYAPIVWVNGWRVLEEGHDAVPQ